MFIFKAGKVLGYRKAKIAGEGTGEWQGDVLRRWAGSGGGGPKSAVRMKAGPGGALTVEFQTECEVGGEGWLGGSGLKWQEREAHPPGRCRWQVRLHRCYEQRVAVS